MTALLVFLTIILPVASGAICFCLTKTRGLKEILTVLITAINLAVPVMLYKQDFSFTLPWFGYGYELAFRYYHFSWFITLAAGGFAFLLALYSAVWVARKTYAPQYYAYFLITLGMLNGAVLADNLLAMFFFWEGMLLTMFGFIIIGNPNAYKTAVKSFIIVGVCDLCLMFGIGLTGNLAGNFTMSQINLPLGGLASLAFILMMIGAISKAGSMPFHSWIPDAALDAPAPFMAFLPAALEKLLGIYLLSRITLDLFKLDTGSWLSPLLMITGAVTILLAVAMALIQTDYKRLLSYHAISQVGYMILGIGTCVPAGIVGGIFHMINHATYKCGLFLTGAAVEHKTGTTDLHKLGGLASRMPLTFICFLITAASISGVPPFNGFFSKELVYDGALERGTIYYIAAILGSFLTAASFLKLGHAAYLGKLQEEHKTVKEAPILMLIPMVIIAAVCVLFGVYNSLPLNHLIQPILGATRMEGHNFAGFPHNLVLIIMTLVALAAALANHLFGVKRSGSGLGAADHIHYAPVLHGIYDRAEKRYFDPYDIGIAVAQGAGKVLWHIDRAIDWIYERLIVAITFALTGGIRKAYNGNYSSYILGSLAGAAIFIYALMKFYH